jgi:hypothetical protein
LCDAPFNPVKTCTYCGRQNEDTAEQCAECASVEFRDSNVPPLIDLPPDESPTTIEFETLKKEDVNYSWVTLLRCQQLLEADIIAGRLRAAGILVFIPDEFLMQTISNTYGFIRLQVSPSQYEAARELLQSTPPTQS